MKYKFTMRQAHLSMPLLRSAGIFTSADIISFSTAIYIQRKHWSRHIKINSRHLSIDRILNICSSFSLDLPSQTLKLWHSSAFWSYLKILQRRSRFFSPQPPTHIKHSIHLKRLHTTYYKINRGGCNMYTLMTSAAIVMYLPNHSIITNKNRMNLSLYEHTYTNTIIDVYVNKFVGSNSARGMQFQIFYKIGLFYLFYAPFAIRGYRGNDFDEMCLLID